MHRVHFLRAIVIVAALSIGSGLGEPKAHASQGFEPDLNIGKGAFEANCVRCHGTTGAGDGPDAKKMHPHPRNLAEGIFKFRTTASGTPPMDEDLLSTLATGLPGSRMPDFQRLPEETRRHLVAYMKSLSTIFKDQTPEPVDLGVDPGPKKADAAKGRELYTQLGCNACHGNFGRGDGPSAATLVDNWNEPIRPADLTSDEGYRAGASPTEIVKRVLTGMDGTPMPSYADAVSREDAWHLAYYVRSLQEQKNFARTIEAIKSTEPLPASAEDPAWGKAPRHDLRLSSLFYRQGEEVPTTVKSVEVRALYQEGVLLLRLAWNDPNETSENPSDAAAVIFLPERRMKMKAGSLRNWPASWESSLGETVAWSAVKSEAGEASYQDGQWRVLIRRPLTPHGSQRLALSDAPPRPAGQRLALSDAPPRAEAERAVPVGIMIWDGGNKEEGRLRAHSTWVDLILVPGAQG